MRPEKIVAEVHRLRCGIASRHAKDPIEHYAATIEQDRKGIVKLLIYMQNVFEREEREARLTAVSILLGHTVQTFAAKYWKIGLSAGELYGLLDWLDSEEDRRPRAGALAVLRTIKANPEEVDKQIRLRLGPGEIPGTYHSSPPEDSLEIPSVHTPQDLALL